MIEGRPDLDSGYGEKTIAADDPDADGLVVLRVRLREEALEEIRRIVREELKRARTEA
jgi:hypothetical protein